MAGSPRERHALSVKSRASAPDRREVTGLAGLPRLAGLGLGVLRVLVLLVLDGELRLRGGPLDLVRAEVGRGDLVRALLELVAHRDAREPRDEVYDPD